MDISDELSCYVHGKKEKEDNSSTSFVDSSFLGKLQNVSPSLFFLSLKKKFLP